jgi:hypothetical protein
VGLRKLVFGLHANRKWHYTGPLGQPNRHVKWFIRSVGAPQPETIINLGHSFVSAITGMPPPWTIEAREAEEETKAEEEAGNGNGNGSGNGNGNGSGNGAIHAEGSEKAPSTTSSVRSARALARYKRIMAATGFVGTYICWAVFTWCVPRVLRCTCACEHASVVACANRRCAHDTHSSLRPLHERRFIFVYGMLIYKLLGDQAQSEFARSWGASRGRPTDPKHASVHRSLRHALLTCRIRCARRHFVRLELSLRVAVHLAGGGQGRNHPGHPRAAVHDAQLQLARGAAHGSLCPATTVMRRMHALGR